MNLTPLRLLGLTMLLACAAADRAADAPDDLPREAVTLGVGDALPLGGAEHAEKARWESSDPAIVAVYQNGYIVGLAPGAARVRLATSGRDLAECAVTVRKVERPLINPASLRQYEDNRSFTVDGRLCYGSELNGRRAVEPEEREHTQANRVLNPAPPAKDQPREWEVAPETPVYDGAGILMGTIPADLRADDGRTIPTAKFNFGMSKVMNGRMFLYGFSIQIKPSEALRKVLDDDAARAGSVGTSAWVPLDNVINREALLERAGVGKVKLPRLPLDKRVFRITGGNPKQYHTEHGEMRIVKNPNAEPVPSHYLRRPSGTVNIIYSVPGFGLGGQGLDSLLVGNDVRFRPARGARVFVQPTYFPGKHPRAGQVSPMTMTFVYGAAEVKGIEPVYGWVALEALEPVK